MFCELIGFHVRFTVFVWSICDRLRVFSVLVRCIH